MAESTLNLSLTDLQAAVGVYLGFGRGASFSETAWTARKQAAIDESVKSGLRMFYFPPLLEGQSSPYDWSFLRPIRQATLVSGERTVRMPDDFAGLEGQIRLIDSGKYPRPIDQTNEQVIAQKYFALPNQTGQPQFAAVQAIPPAGQTTGPRAQLYFFPAADQDYTIEFQYYLAPDSLQATFPYAHGGAVHAETIVAACIAAAELYQDGTPGARNAYFRDRLRASIGLDERNKAQVTGYNADPRYNRGRYGMANRHYVSPAVITFDGVTPG